jgi:gamma-glutamylcyclotransferase (GGCT)/AIG2-like uncharacterized protein YtfP
MDNNNKILIASYGTLRKNYSNSFLINRGDNWLGTGKTVEKYQLKASGIPYVNKTPDTQITIDLWEIEPEILPRVDRLEGYDPDNHDRSWYKRELIPVEVQGKKYDAWLYFNEGGSTIIESGDYSDYRR